MKKIKVIVNEKPYEVEVGDMSISPFTVVVNGQSYQVTLEGEQVQEVRPVASAPAAPAPRPVAPAPVPAPAPKPAAAPAASGDVLTAPMPGVILDIAVKPGDKVTVGQQLCALEAMKMKNAIRSPREGTIASVEVQDGQRVNYGEVLFRFS
ncbi:MULTISPECIES: biotin/lipoyl-containing protein [Anaerolinea]|uniref:Methylmalonyl-CoA decarboxylase gamma-subunit n=1 Tax=Anaerolinea thermophila (strain DSM 14523 / JCM 11388 / NBRC 100420 / UNI-1) TaxID=926569 RepID=E8N1L1_ANATU|nr:MULTISPECIES: biotin/lipoyl-containing protein [Anaerolinea]BAJ62616.1 putative methylmalonyl-CoA decarboxylase gamma-subunit [Anaerolinea thermophila UNI-1]